MSVDELNANLKELMDSMFNFKFQKALQQLEHPQKIRHIKRDIARVKTKLNEENKGGKDAKKNIER